MTDLQAIAILYAADYGWSPPGFDARIGMLVAEFKGVEETDNMAGFLRAHAGELDGRPPSLAAAFGYSLAAFPYHEINRAMADLADALRLVRSLKPANLPSALVYLERLESVLKNAEIESVPW